MSARDRDPAPPDVDALARTWFTSDPRLAPLLRALPRGVADLANNAFVAAFRAGFEAARPVAFAAGVRAAAETIRLLPDPPDDGTMGGMYPDWRQGAADAILALRAAAGGREGQP